MNAYFIEVVYMNDEDARATLLRVHFLMFKSKVHVYGLKDSIFVVIKILMKMFLAI